MKYYLGILLSCMGMFELSKFIYNLFLYNKYSTISIGYNIQTYIIEIIITLIVTIVIIAYDLVNGDLEFNSK